MTVLGDEKRILIVEPVPVVMPATEPMPEPNRQPATEPNREREPNREPIPATVNRSPMPRVPAITS